MQYACPNCHAVEQYDVITVTPGGHSMECTECDRVFTDGDAEKLRNVPEHMTPQEYADERHDARLESEAAGRAQRRYERNVDRHGY